MNNLKAKLKKQGGFTLVEMLIVVAIIAILVAVSIPLVTSALERTKHATDAANERAAKAEILLCYLADTGKEITAGTTYYYDAPNGKIVDSSTSVGYGKHLTHEDQILAIRISNTEATKDEVQMVWVASDALTADFSSPDLCSTAKDLDHST